MIALALAAAFGSAQGSVAEAERSFAAMAAAQGQWTAFRAFAAPDALILADGVVPAADLLAGRADPAKAIAWAPDHILLACDGSLAVSTGAWRAPDGARGGRFVTVWQLDAAGRWTWRFDGGTDGAHAPVLPATAREDRADCALPRAAPPGGTPETGGVSADGSLRWRIDPGPLPRTYLVRVDAAADGLWRLAGSYVVGR